MKTIIVAKVKLLLIYNVSFLFCWLSVFEAKAQNIGINGTGANAHPSALLDVDDAGINTKGLLIPRIPLTAINVATPVTSPATSLLVYNTASASTGTNAVSPGYYYWDGVKWVRFAYTPSGSSANHWTLLGNAGTNQSLNYLGTTDAQDLVFRTNSLEAVRINTVGNVGVGVATPSANLHVYVASGFAGTVLPLRSGITVDVIPASSNGYSIFKGTGGTLFSGGLVYGLNLDLNPTGTVIGTNFGVYVNNELKNYFSNRVGIGTANPAFKLHVENGNIAQTYTTNVSHSIYMGNPSGRNWQLYHLSSTDANAPNGFMFEHFDGSVWQRRMTINQAGNVGIGASNPNARLYLKDNLPNASVDLVIENTAASGQAWVLESVSTYTNITNGSFLIGNRTTSQNHFAITPAGNVGIGTSINLNARTTINGGQALPGGWSKVLTLEANHPAIQFKSTNTYVQPGALGGSAWIEYDDAWPISGIGGLSFRVADTLNQFNTSNRAMIINKHGNVGINTVAPTTKLHVVSTTASTAFRMQDGTEGLGKVLKSDASGNASWSDPTDITYDLASSLPGPIAATASAVGSSIVLTKGVYYVQPYNLLQGLTFSSSYYSVIDVIATSGSIISGNVVRDFTALGTSVEQYYTMPGFIVKVTSPTATVAIRLYHGNGGTFSLLAGYVLYAQFTKMN